MQPALKAVHELIIRENEAGGITRQEVVSMIPPLLLDVQPSHKVRALAPVVHGQKNVDRLCLAPVVHGKKGMRSGGATCAPLCAGAGHVRRAGLQDGADPGDAASRRGRHAHRSASLTFMVEALR